jgi:mannose-1-phosphate guanylyltransferase/mannose-6-phosphate isomerase
MDKTAFPFIPVILCGGLGTRLWPYSREEAAKQFLKLPETQNVSLLQITIDRILNVCRVFSGKIVITAVTNMKPEIESHIPFRSAEKFLLLEEPCARNTAAAIALSAQYVSKQFGPDALMWVCPSDHVIEQADKLPALLDDACAAAQEGFIVTFGIRPSRAETGYGYIKMGKSLTDDKACFLTDAFLEKPNRETAEALIRSGDYLWNSGMFVFRAATALEEFTRCAPNVLAAIQNESGNGLATAYAHLPSLSFDKAVMEKSNRVAVVPCDIGWADVGSWESLWEISEKDEHGNSARGKIHLHGTTNSLIRGNGKLIACAGIDNLVVIETPDALLIADKSKPESLKNLVNLLREQGLQEAFRKPENPDIVAPHTE